MNLTVIIFFSCLGAYLIGLGVFVLVKRHKNKKHFNKELEAKKNEEAQNHDINA